MSRFACKIRVLFSCRVSTELLGSLISLTKIEQNNRFKICIYSFSNMQHAAVRAILGEGGFVTYGNIDSSNFSISSYKETEVFKNFTASIFLRKLVLHAIFLPSVHN